MTTAPPITAAEALLDAAEEQARPIARIELPPREGQTWRRISVYAKGVRMNSRKLDEQINEFGYSESFWGYRVSENEETWKVKCQRARLLGRGARGRAAALTLIEEALP